MVAAATQGSIACGSNRNHEQREAFAATLPNDDPPGCLYLCQPDPPPELVDCQTPVAGLDFLPIWNFNPTALADDARPISDADGEEPFNLLGTAPYMYTYTDRSAQNLNTHGWEPDTATTVRCQGAAEEVAIGDEQFTIEGLDQAFHLKGGPFRDWGGGFGMRLDWILYSQGNCASDTDRAEYCSPPDAEYPFDQYTFDLTSYDGISFWARRGPDSQPLLRVMIGDRRTDDDISFLMYEADPERPRFCERNLKCGCPLGLPCTELTVEQSMALDEDDRCPQQFSICWDPAEDPYLANSQAYQVCGDQTCNCGYEAFPETPDPTFAEKTCNTFAFRGGIVDNFCFDPVEGPPPYENNYLCGDHWTSPVHLTTEWKFYKVPFTALLQQGWAKEQHQFDLNYVSMLRFSWDKGYIDYWIDDVGFYREARPAEP